MWSRKTVEKQVESCPRDAGSIPLRAEFGTASPFRTQPNAAMSTIFPDQPEERDISALRTVFDPETLVKKGIEPFNNSHTRSVTHTTSLN